MGRSKPTGASSSTVVPAEQVLEQAAESSRPRTRGAARASSPAATTAEGTQATMDRFLSRMLAKPGATTSAKVNPKAEATAKPAGTTTQPSTTHSSNTSDEEHQQQQECHPERPSSSSAAAPKETATAAEKYMTDSSRTQAEAQAATANTPPIPPATTSSESKKEGKKTTTRTHKSKESPQTTSTMEALRGARRKPLTETTIRKEHDEALSGSDGDAGSSAVAASNRSPTQTSSTRGTPAPSKQPSIIHLSSQPSSSLEDLPPVVYTIDSTLPEDYDNGIDKDDSSIAILPDPAPAPAPPAKQETEQDDSLASHIPSVNRSIISRWIGDVADETNPRREEEEESNNDAAVIQETQQPTMTNSGAPSSPLAQKTKPFLHSKQSAVLSSSPNLARGDSGLPLPIATPTPRAITTHSAHGDEFDKAAQATRPSVTKSGAIVLVPDSLPPMQSWMSSLPEDDHEMEGEGGDDDYHQPWQTRLDEAEGPTPSTMGEGETFLATLAEGASTSPVRGRVQSSLPTTQPMPEDGEEERDEERSPKIRHVAAHGLPAGLTSSFLEELGVRPEELGLRQSTIDQSIEGGGDLDKDEGEADDEVYGHRRKRAKRGGRTEELMYEMQHPRHELPLDMTGAAGQESNSQQSMDESVHMAQRDMFPSTLGSLPQSSPSYQSSLEISPSSDRRTRRRSRVGASKQDEDEKEELDQYEKNTATDTSAGASGSGSGSGEKSKHRISGGSRHSASNSSKSSGGSSLMVSLPSPPSLSFGDNIPASYVDELAAIAEQMSDKEKQA